MMDSADRRDALFFVEALSRARPLTDAEIHRLDQLLRRRPLAPVLRRWSREDDGLLIGMQGARKHSAEIARTLKRTPDAVRSRIKHMKKKGQLHD